MDSECKVIDLFSHPRARLARREPAASPFRGDAPVADLFATKASDARHFGRIKEILAVRIAKDRLFVELYMDEALPEAYLRTLALVVDDAPSGASTVTSIELVRTDGRHHAVLRSMPLKGALKGADKLHQGALVRVTCKSGWIIQNMIHPLLLAKP